MPVLQLLHVTVSHLRSKELTRLHLDSDYADVMAEIDCGDQLIVL